MQNIILNKINKSYQSEPNIAEPVFTLCEDKLKLTFPLNHQIFDFKEGQKGAIEFENVAAFRSGAPNDEGFDYGDNKLWNRKNVGSVDWDSFYEVLNTPKEYFDIFYKNKTYQDSSDLKHYVFFMKESTFECLAKSYKEFI